MNNFKNLNQEKISQFEKNQAPLVERKIKSNLNFFQFLQLQIELFLPKQAQIYGKMLEEDKKYTNVGGSSTDKLVQQSKYPS